MLSRGSITTDCVHFGVVNPQNSCFLSTEDPNKIRTRTQEETKKLLKDLSKQEATFYFQLTGSAKITFKRAKEFILTGVLVFW